MASACISSRVAARTSDRDRASVIACKSASVDARNSARAFTSTGNSTGTGTQNRAATDQPGERRL
jgi:hypothetical protein